MGENISDRVAGRRAHAVEAAEHAVAEAHGAQHRHHAPDRLIDGFRRRSLECHEALPERQQIEQQLHQNARVAADVAAVGEDLRGKLGGERLLGLLEMGLAPGNAEVAIEQRHQRQQARLAARSIAPGGGQPHELAGHAVRGAVVGARVDVFQ
jgi:hypothetical protein